MKAILFFTAATLICAAACNDRPTDKNTPADNTKVNESDKNATLTPLDQKENEGDRTITQKIRQDVVGANDLSTDAKNVKIITINGVVTLRGPVKSEAEKTTVASFAQKEAGVTRVDNQLEIAN